MIPDVKKITIRNCQFHVSIYEKGSPLWLIVTHGIGEHSGRYQFIYDLFGQYFNILTYDLRGHGLTSGRKGYVDHFNEFAFDLEGILEFLEQNYKMKRFVLFGHSMGALITSMYLQNLAKPSFYPEKVFLSSPPVSVGGILGDVFRHSPLFVTDQMRKLPGFEIGGLVDLKYLSHDLRIKDLYCEDPLNILKLHTKLCLELVHAGREVFSKPLRIHCPLYASIGTEDQIVHVKAFQEYFKFIEKSAITFEVEGAYHELHNEIERYRVPYLNFLKTSLMSSLFDQTL